MPKLYLGPLTDSRRWDHIRLREDDIIVVTPPKAGTTWMQTIITLLLSGDPGVEPELSLKMPWVDIRFREISEVDARIEAMTGRRSLKSHTPLDGLPVGREAHYICVFRHPLDIHLSYRAHLKNFPIHFFDHWYPQDDADGLTFRRFLDGGAEGYDGDAVTLAHILRHYQAARALDSKPNVTLFHYADMTRDAAGAFAQVAQLLGISHPPEVMRDLIETASFSNMRAHASRFAPGGGTGFMKSDAAFFDSGSSGKWVGQLSQEELAAYDAILSQELSASDRAWLEYGDQRAP